MNREANQGEDFQVDLTNCDRKPIHTPGLTQAHGVLIALDDELNIAQISESCGTHFGKPAAELLGKPLENLLGESYFDYLTTEVLTQNLEANPLYLNPAKINETDFEAAAHRCDDVLILEFERPTEGALTANQNLYSALRSKLSSINNAKSIREFCQKGGGNGARFYGFRPCDDLSFRRR